MLPLRFIALLFWVVGVQVHELVSTVAFALFVLSFALDVKKLSLAGLRQWEPLWLFLFWSLAAPSLTGHPPDATGFFRTLDWAVVPLVAYTATTLTRAQWRVLAIAAFVTLTVSSVVAGFQHFGVMPPLSTFDTWGWTQVSFFRVYERIGDSDRFMAGGLLFHRLKYSHVSGLVIVALVVAAQRVERKGLVLAVGAFSFVGVWLFPYARMGAVAMTAAIGATLILASASRVKALLLTLGMGVLAAAVVLVVPSLRERFIGGLTDQGSGQRTQHLAAGLEAVKQFPLAGVGPGQFRPSKFATAEMAGHVKDNPGKAHNQLVSMAAETGVIGAGLFVYLLGWMAVRARKLELGALTIGVIVQFAVLSLVHDPLFQAPFSQGLVLLLGLGLAPRLAGEEGAP